jgi:hypothetical protein
MSIGIRRFAPIIAAVLSLAGVGVASMFEPEPLPPCPTRNAKVIVQRTNNGIVLVPCAPANKPKGGQD